MRRIFNFGAAAAVAILAARVASVATDSAWAHLKGELPEYDGGETP